MSIVHEPLIEPLVLGPELAGTLMTPEEFDAVEECDDNFVYELVHGVLVVAPPPSEGERGPNGLLDYLLRKYGDSPEGAAYDYTLTEHNIRTGDSYRRAGRVIWAGLGRIPNVRRDVPAIILEFVSRGKRDRRRDYEEKRDEYLAIGVKEYWVIDRFRRVMTVFRPAGDSYSETVVQENDVYESDVLPGFQLPLAKVLAEADMLAAAQEE